MPNYSSLPLGRRDLLRLGLVVALVGATGCSDSSTPSPVDTAILKGGNRDRLKTLQEKAELSKAKQKPKAR
jgi:hypothetical protein